MSIEIIVPSLGESVSDATVARWIKMTGDDVLADEPLVELETDKVTLEVPAPAAGQLGNIVALEGAVVEVGAILAHLEEASSVKQDKSPSEIGSKQTLKKPEKSLEAPVVKKEEGLLSPAVRRLVTEYNLNPSQLTGTGVGGRLTKADVLNVITSSSPNLVTGGTMPIQARKPSRDVDAAREERVPMSKLRKVIASRLKAAQNSAAILTTFNEVDMSGLMALRSDFKEAFELAHETRLGFMGVFVQASIKALQQFPAVNAEIDGDDIIYKDYYNIGVAVGTPQGLVVPVIKDAEGMNLATTEQVIADFGGRAREGKIKPDEMADGTFTISNGGVYGSLMSTPILNPPQSAILGLHKIEKRPVVVNDGIVIRPMMYLALSYDHRIIDGREAVSFLKRIKDFVEDPRRLLLDV